MTWWADILLKHHEQLVSIWNDVKLITIKKPVRNILKMEMWHKIRTTKMQILKDTKSCILFQLYESW